MSIETNLELIRKQIKFTAEKAGRDPAAITLVAVTKYVGYEEINQAIKAGITDIGENRVQDAIAKFPLLDGKVTKHLIGTLQTNKVKAAVGEFNLIHSVDRVELAEALAKEASKQERQVEILIQLNISGEVTKHGLKPDNLPDLIEKIKGYPNLIPSGLMTIAPISEEPENVRPIFRSLREIFEKTGLNQRLGSSWRYLSMGMSQDYQIAIEEGANLVRIGTAIFTSK